MDSLASPVMLAIRLIIIIIIIVVVVVVVVVITRIEIIVTLYKKLQGNFNIYR